MLAKLQEVIALTIHALSTARDLIPLLKEQEIRTYHVQ